MKAQAKFEMRKQYLKKTYDVFLIVVCLTALMELFLMLRGFMFFDLTRVKHWLYLGSYIFLFLSSGITAAVLAICRRKEHLIKPAVNQTYVYVFSLIVWATFVSAVDIIADGDSMVMVYVMICMAVGVLSLIKPIVFAVTVITGSVIIVVCHMLWREEALSSGFYINFVIFVLLALFVNSHNYRLSMREYEAGKDLEKLSYTDQLTGVYNRRSLDEQVIGCAERRERYLFLLLDIDDFKTVNDGFGHAVGDRCLVLTAQKLTERFGERVYRFGGDEFAVICQLEEQEACAKIDRINQELKLAQEDVELHLSAGIYRATERDSSRQVFVRADRALYRAKHAGKDRWALYDPEEQ